MSLQICTRVAIDRCKYVAPWTMHSFVSAHASSTLVCTASRLVYFRCHCWYKLKQLKWKAATCLITIVGICIGNCMLQLD